jgi:ribosomal protein S27E
MEADAQRDAALVPAAAPDDGLPHEVTHEAPAPRGVACELCQSTGMMYAGEDTYVPCPACRGVACDLCQSTGMMYAMEDTYVPCPACRGDSAFYH